MAAQALLGSPDILALVIAFLPLPCVTVRAEYPHIVPGALFRAVAVCRHLYFGSQEGDTAEEEEDTSNQHSYLWQRVFAELGAVQPETATVWAHFNLGTVHWILLPYLDEAVALSQLDTPQSGGFGGYKLVRNQRMYWSFAATDVPRSSFAFTVSAIFNLHHVIVGLSSRIDLAFEQQDDDLSTSWLRHYEPFSDLQNCAVLYNFRGGIITGPGKVECRFHVYVPPEEVQVTIEHDAIRRRMCLAVGGKVYSSVQIPTSMPQRLYGVVAVGSDATVQILPCEVGLYAQACTELVLLPVT